MTPNGDDWAQVEFLRREANKVATLIASSHLTKSEAMLAYHTHWIPSVGYSLGTMTMEPRDLRSIQSQATASFLQKLGFNKHFPRAAVFGPAEMGGLALRDLVVEQGIAQIMTLMDHLYNKTETGKLIRISLATLQMEAGTQGHLLYETIPQLTYISSCWISAIRNFIRTNQIQLEISSLWNFPLQRGGDMFIMDTFRQSGQFSGKDLINLNAVRLYLQVGTLADITSADGQSIDEYAHRAHKCPYRLSSLTWIRQPEISLHQASLWTRALNQNFTANGGTTRLRKPLGRWEGQGHQTWRYYYNYHMHRLEAPISLTQARGYYMKEVYSRRFPRFETAFCIVQFDITQVIPADRVQWDPKNGGSLTASFDTRAAVTAPQASIQVNSYKEYVSRLSPERQRFFAWSKPCGSASWEDIIRKMQQGVNTTKLFEIAPDGGLAESGGSFGVILALGEDELWEMAGPVDGDPNTANSKRSELAGYAASLELLLMFTNWIDFSTNRTMHTQTWIDSSGAGRHISNMLKKKRQNRKYPHDPDLISHIQWLWTQVPNISHKISWVKGHQDTKGSFKELPRNAQLNVLADELATTFARKQLSKKHPTKINPMFFQTCEVSLIVNGQRITAYPQAAIRFHITGTRLRQHLQDSRKPWQDKIWAMIDLQAIGMAYRGMSIVNRLQVSKAIHGWLPTGKQRQQMDSMATSACPCCGESNETQEHIILCQSPKIRAARYKALTRLRSTIVTTKGSSYTWIALHKCLAAWAETGKSPNKQGIHIPRSTNPVSFSLK